MCTESVLKVWEMESGKLVYTITDSHGPNILSCFPVVIQPRSRSGGDDVYGVCPQGLGDGVWEAGLHHYRLSWS